MLVCFLLFILFNFIVLPARSYVYYHRPVSKTQVKSLPRNCRDVQPIKSTPEEVYQKKTSDINPQCNPYDLFRSADGWCNNLEHPDWGASSTCFNRFLPAQYDGSLQFRRAVSGRALPNPRLLSLNISPDERIPSDTVTFMFTVFGQMLAHDMSLASPQDPDGCGDQPAQIDSRCMPIEVLPDDPFYAFYNVSCIALPRSQTCKKEGGGPIEQMNAQTSFIDASFMYGSSQEKMEEIRMWDGAGRLQSELGTDGRELLPSGRDPNDILCSVDDEKCFKTGDPRVNAHASLSSLQTIFLREHNRLVKALRQLNPNWDGEMLFQQARKIVGALMQSITYREYLPLLLGNEFCGRYGLISDPSLTTYDPEQDPSIRNEFTTGVFRIHSMTPSDIGLGRLRMRNTYSNPDLLRSGYSDILLAGACRAPSRTFGRFYTQDVTDHLFQNSSQTFGKDLMAQDIQRGRDHGLPPYAELFNLCREGYGKPHIRDFGDLKPFMTEENIQLLRDNYENLFDVDAIVGSVLESPSSGSMLGPTSTCIISKQFSLLKFGDRFFWEHQNLGVSFTRSQQEALRQDSLSRLMCDNLRITEVQRRALLMPGPDNPVVSCKEIPSLDLTKWTSKI